MIKLIYQSIIEIIFPHFCINCGKKNTLLCSNCYETIEFSSFSFNHLKQMKYLDNIIVPCAYENIVKKLIHEFKYKSIIDIGKVIARLIYRSSNLPNCDLLVPIPISKDKKNLRGFNQSEEITKELSKLINIPYANFLIKTKNTKSQMSINSRKERQNNIKKSFKIDEKISKFYKNKTIKTVLLVDDVITTGSTLDECARVLKDVGIKKVIGLALAHQ